MTHELSEFEIDVLTAFYRPHTPGVIERVNGPDRLQQRKSAIVRLTQMGLLKEVEPWTFRITHAGHTLIDQRVPVTAAPDLLAACKRMIGLIMSMKGESEEQIAQKEDAMAETILMMSSAIAKAEGAD